MVISLYNPRSKKRVTHLDEVREIVLKYRDPKTPVGIVQKAGRPGQHMVISDPVSYTHLLCITTDCFSRRYKYTKCDSGICS